MLFSARCAATIALAIALASCGGAGSPARRWNAAPVADSELATAIADLEFAVASRPADLEARRALAHLQLRAGRPGAALEQFEVLARNRALARDDRPKMAVLLVERAGERSALGEVEAVDDLRTARELDREVEVPAAILDAAYYRAALAALAGGRRDRARAVLAEAAKVGVTADGRRAVLDPSAAELPELGVAASWLWDGGARRVARDLLVQYFERGGRDPAVLRRMLLARRWWGGVGDRPGLLELDQVSAAGVDLCSVAVTVDELGCGRSLASLGRERAAEVRRRAARMYWRSSNPDQAGAWARITLTAWLTGEVDSWFGELTSRVDIDRLLARYPADQLPEFARATLLRAGGDLASARVELTRTLERAAELTAEQRAVVVAEAAMQDVPVERIDALLAAGPVADDGWAVALRDARRRGDPAREAALLARAPATVARAHLLGGRDLGPALAGSPGGDPLRVARDRHALARWLATTRRLHLERGRDAVLSRWRALGRGEPKLDRFAPLPLGVPEPLAIAVRLGLPDPGPPERLIELVRTYLREPAAADRLAGDLVGGALAIGSRGPVVAALFAALGDPARALSWWDRVLASSPRHPTYQFAGAAAAALAGELARAEVHVITAAAASGDGGAVNAAAARLYGDVDAPVYSLMAGRRAEQLCAPGEDLEVLATIASADRALGRTRDAEAARALAIDRIAPDYRDAATATWRSRRDRLLARPEPESLALYPADPGLAVARAEALFRQGRADRAIAALAEAAAWNPRDVATRATLLAHLDPDSARAERRIAELLLIGLGDGAGAEAALTALEPILTARGQASAAEAVVAERRARWEGAWLRQPDQYRTRGCW